MPANKALGSYHGTSGAVHPAGGQALHLPPPTEKTASALALDLFSVLRPHLPLSEDLYGPRVPALPFHAKPEPESQGALHRI